MRTGREKAALRTRLTAAVGMALALGLWARGARASTGNPAELDIQVTFNGTMSVAIDSATALTSVVTYSTRTASGAADAIAVANSSAAVYNNGTIDEIWQLSAANYAYGSTSVAGSWVLQTGSTMTAMGQDQDELQALFISSVAASACPAFNSADWNQPSIVTGSGVTYKSTLFSDITGFSTQGEPDTHTGGSDGDMLVYNSSTGVGARGLCARVFLPGSVSTQNQQDVLLTITSATAL